MRRALFLILLLLLCSHATAQEPTDTPTPTPMDTATPTMTPTVTVTPTPCPDLSRQVLDAGTGQTIIECYSDPGTMTEPTAIVLDGLAAAEKQQVDLDYQALRNHWQIGQQWLAEADACLDIARPKFVALKSIPNSAIDTTTELRDVLRDLGTQLDCVGVSLDRVREINERQNRVIARIVGEIAVPPQATPTPTP